MRPTAAAEKPLHWVGSSKKDLLDLPEEVIDDLGYALGVVQLGGMPPSAKPWKGLGAGVLEIGQTLMGNAYRAVHRALQESGLCLARVPEEVSFWCSNCQARRRAHCGPVESSGERL